MVDTRLIFTFFLVALGMLANVALAQQCVFTDEVTGVTASGGIFNISYTIDCGAGIISFAVLSPSHGWAAIGFNNVSSMVYGDLHMARPDCHGNPFIMDLTGSSANGGPDTDQGINGTFDNWNMTWTYLNGVTAFNFSRYLNTGDPIDRIIAPGLPGYLLYSFRTADFDFNYHGPTSRNLMPYDFFANAPACCSATLNLQAPSFKPPQPYLNESLPSSWLTPVPTAPAADAANSCVWSPARIIIEPGFYADHTFDCAAGIFYATVYSSQPGWTAWGINPSLPAMFGGDMVLGYTACDFNASVSDYNVPANSTEYWLIEDTVHNVLSGSLIRNGTYTILSFSRYFNTGDPQDQVLQPGMVYMLFGYRYDNVFGHHDYSIPLYMDLFEGAPNCCLNYNFTVAGAPKTAGPTAAPSPGPTTAPSPGPTTAPSSGPTPVPSPGPTPVPTTKSSAAQLSLCLSLLLVLLGVLLF